MSAAQSHSLESLEDAIWRVADSCHRTDVAIMDEETAYIVIRGLAPDIVGLSKLFPIGEGDLQVEGPIGIIVEPEANGFKVNDNGNVLTRVTGPFVLAALREASGDRFKQNSLTAVTQMLNAAGFVCDPEFRPVAGISWGVEKQGGSSWGVPADQGGSDRKRTSHGRVPEHPEMAIRVAEAVKIHEAARRVFWILQDPNPGWVGYNMILEEIAFHEGIAMSKLEDIDLAPPGFIAAFKNAANNARDLNQKPRHGNNLNSKTNNSPKVQLWDAMVTIRDIVHCWLFSCRDVDAET